MFDLYLFSQLELGGNDGVIRKALKVGCVVLVLSVEEDCTSFAVEVASATQRAAPTKASVMLFATIETRNLFEWSNASIFSMQVKNLFSLSHCKETDSLYSCTHFT